jgi:hypothetical protein
MNNQTHPNVATAVLILINLPAYKQISEKHCVPKNECEYNGNQAVTEIIPT